MTLKTVHTPLLSVDGLCTTFGSGDVSIPAVRDVGFSVSKGEILGLVGESGSGKSVTLRSILGLSRRYGDTTGSVLWKGENLVSKNEGDMRRIRGGEI
ncbi:MAG: ATP-binding cassette domain-containing protein, partial [Roseibium sp.]|nr:ATP-binding cassette domain-containing protein [Roseibium sp.]